MEGGFWEGVHWGMGFREAVKRNARRKRCEFCGRLIPVDSNFCPYCGKKLASFGK
ncbi:MAG: zinc-ribbon domain-containing protein [Nitrososphaeria archaeon]|nr:zinc-ribbon domain-containing protein [Nitrososphaeria archaeon]MDW8021863.1 zinc-ribbon domain-containing protein [Nitrososphaerota archaeon]